MFKVPFPSEESCVGSRGIIQQFVIVFSDSDHIVKNHGRSCHSGTISHSISPRSGHDDVEYMGFVGADLLTPTSVGNYCVSELA